MKELLSNDEFWFGIVFTAIGIMVTFVAIPAAYNAVADDFARRAGRASNVMIQYCPEDQSPDGHSHMTLQNDHIFVGP